MLKEDILQLLKAGKDTYLSGQRISAQLGVSRAAVWKAVEALRKDGYGIDSRSNCGYRLVRVPDVMTQEALSDIGTRQVGRKVLYYDRLDSTNNEIKRLSIDQVENGLAVIADCQTGGRGRRGRSFLSPAGKGLYLSVLMQPHCSVEELSMLTAWSAVALCRAVERVCGVRPGIKWPNDLVMQGRKLCGVLTELELEAETGLPRYVIVGIGTNVLQTEADFGPEVAPIAISLEQALGQAPARTALAKEILRAMDDLYRDFPQERAQYLEQYRRDCLTLGRPVTVLRSSGARNGFATGINEDFSLTVRWEDGTEEALSAGEVSVRGLYGYV